MQTNLVGQYVAVGWGTETQFHEIVAVTVDRDELYLWARNDDGVISLYVGDGRKTFRNIPDVDLKKFV